MLQDLYIENYALIPQISLEFGPGLNILTGETGSGKSIVVDALGLLLGGKGSPDLVRSGSERAVVVGRFSLGKPGALASLAEELGLDIGDDSGELLIKRELHSAGKTRAFVNDRPATVSALRAISRWLSEIHGQNEQHDLFSAAVRLEMLDRAGSLDGSVVAAAHAIWRAAEDRLATFNRDEQEKLRLLDLWGFQKREIEEVAPRPGEDAQLELEKRTLANSGRIHAALDAAYQQLYEAPGAAASAVAAALRGLEDAGRFDATLEPLCGELRSARVTLEEAAFTVRGRLEKLDANPQRLEQVEERLAALDKLKRKYGPTLADVAAHFEKISVQLQEMESSEELAAQARKELDAAAAKFQAAAARLSTQRKEAAKRLEKSVEKNLGELAMDGTRFRVEFSESEWRAVGIDQVDFLVSANPGEPLQPLKDVASGGELSRLMLALKLAVGGKGLGETLVFDEIDAGIGGRVAEIVGRKLKSLASTYQVLCVTHLPQIAAFADRDYFVEKQEKGGRTVTTVRLLEEKERAGELARMLSGSKITDAVLTHAGEMLKTAKKK